MTSAFRILTGAEVAALAGAVAQVARELARGVPAPRGAPFFGLDMGVKDAAILEAFCQQGIFRKYERALVLGGALGGGGRWWAVRFGCTVVGIEPRRALAAAASALSRRAGLTAQTQFQTGDGRSLPLQEGRFTHAWIVPALSACAEPRAVLRETFRVLRPGGGLTARVSGPEAPEIELVAAAGFDGIAARRLAETAPPQYLLTAHQRLERFIRETFSPPSAARLLSCLDDPRERDCGGARHTQLFARRPS